MEDSKNETNVNLRLLLVAWLGPVAGLGYSGRPAADSPPDVSPP